MSAFKREMLSTNSNETSKVSSGQANTVFGANENVALNATVE